MATYLQLVNDLLVRLREPEVATVQANSYSKLMGKLINDAKRRVEDSFNWNALLSTMSIVTVSGVYGYAMTGTNNRFKVIDVFNDTDNYALSNAPISWMTQQYIAATPQIGPPMYYGFNGVDSNGDVRVDFFPIPSGGQNLRINMYLPQEELSNDSDVLLVPSFPVIQGAYAVALAERGEDGGLMASEAANLYRDTLASCIAIESSRFIENDVWVAV